jgi:hypothetical protein
MNSKSGILGDLNMVQFNLQEAIKIAIPFRCSVGTNEISLRNLPARKKKSIPFMEKDLLFTLRE